MLRGFASELSAVDSMYAMEHVDRDPDDLNRPYQDEEWLRQKYVREGLTQSEVADEAGCSQHTISRWLREHDISTRDRGDYEVPYFTTGEKGYERWRTQIDGELQTMFVHRLLAIAEYGIDAVKGMDVHHENHNPWDNRPQNISLRDAGDHMSEHRLKEVESGERLERRFNNED